jgi:glyoxylase-like metal-dependent hydrolase (beta-lactamase superfamily II)
VTGEKENVLIDTGIGSRNLRKLRKQFSVDKILLSHCHEDHTCGLRFLKNSKIFIHELDKEGVESIKYLQKIYGLEDPNFNEVFEAFMLSMGYRETKVDETFKNKKIFALGNIQIEVIHTPGHSAGHCCFLIKPQNVIFLADIDLTSLGPWYGSTDGNITDFIESIEKLMHYKFNAAVTSHKGVYYKNIKQKLSNYLDIIYKRDKIILENLSKKQTIDELTKKALIYGKIPEPEEFYLVAEKLMVKKHLERLKKEGKIEEKDG